MYGAPEDEELVALQREVGVAPGSLLSLYPLRAVLQLAGRQVRPVKPVGGPEEEMGAGRRGFGAPPGEKALRTPALQRFSPGRRRGLRPPHRPAQADLRGFGGSFLCSNMKLFLYFAGGAKPDETNGRKRTHRTLLQERRGLKGQGNRP